MKYDDPTAFRSEYDKDHEYWQSTGFYTFRNDAQDWINRRATFKFDPFLEENRQGIDIQKPQIEEARDKWVQILTLDRPRYDASSNEDTEEAKDDVEKDRVWLAASAMRQNKNGFLTKAYAESIAEYGVSIERKDWNAPLEPDDDYYAKKGLKDDDDDGRLKEREAYYRDREDPPFTTVPINPLECCSNALGGEHTKFWQRFVVSYSEGKHGLKSLDGKKVTVNNLGKLVLLGDRRPVNEDAYETDDVRKKQIEVIILDYKDPESGEWWCCEYICWEGEDWTEAQKLNEYRNPLGMSRYYVTERGDAPVLQTNPHLRYRPLLTSTIVHGSELAYLETVEAIILRMQVDGRFFYMDMSKATAEALTALGVDVTTTNNAGAQTMIAREVTAGSNVITAVPGEIKVWQWPSLESLREKIASKTIEFRESMPNRFLTASYGEAREPDQTATQWMGDKQAAALPASSHLDMYAATCIAKAEGERNAIIFWDEEEEDEIAPDGETEEDEGKPSRRVRNMKLKQYRVITQNDMPLETNPVDPGHEVVVTADTMARNFTILCTIKNVTQAEQIQNDAAADDAYARGAITKEQWQKKRGAADPRRQIKDVEKERQREAIAAELQPIRIANMKKYISAETQMDLMTPAPPLRTEQMQQQQSQGQQMPGSSIAQPAVTPAPVPGPEGTAGPGGIV